MDYKQTEIADCIIIYPKRFPDERGVFFELYNDHRYLENFIHMRDGPGNPLGSILIQSKWRQTNCSVSNRHVVRGIHVTPFAKLVTCVLGHVWDVVVDMRKESPTYLKWVGIDLAHDKDVEPTQVYVPPGCGHGFFAYEEGSVLIYQQNGTYDPYVETTIHWRDPTLAIAWPDAEDYIVSRKDELGEYVRR